MNEGYYNMVCEDSSEENVILKNNTSIPINNCNNYTNHTDSYTESEFRIFLFQYLRKAILYIEPHIFFLRNINLHQMYNKLLIKLFIAKYN